MENRRFIEWFAILALGVFLGAVISAAAFSSATGLSFRELFVEGKLKQMIKEQGTALDGEKPSGLKVTTYTAP